LTDDDQATVHQRSHGGVAGCFEPPISGDSVLASTVAWLMTVYADVVSGTVVVLLVAVVQMLAPWWWCLWRRPSRRSAVTMRVKKPIPSWDDVDGASCIISLLKGNIGHL
jgi:hypothetical protein